MPLFDNNWETLGYYRGNIDFYSINTALFGGWQNAMPQEIANALTNRFTNDLVCATRADPVRWFLRKVTNAGVTSLAENDPIEGAATTKSTGCIEHTVHWPAIGGANMPVKKTAKKYQTQALAHSGNEFFTAGGTVIIYSTWQPCLSCCNSLFALTREHGLNINLVVRFKRLYDIEISGPLADATLVIPRPALILSNANPAPGDRAVFLFHDDVEALKNVHRHVRHLGEMRPVVYRDTRPNPHHDEGNKTPMHPGGEPCQSPAFKDAKIPWDRNLPYATCTRCNADVGLHPLGSGLPWTLADNDANAEGYDPTRHYAASRLVT